MVSLICLEKLCSYPYRLRQKDVVVGVEVEGEPVAHARPRLGKYSTYTPKKTRDYRELLAWHIRSDYREEIDNVNRFGLRVFFYRSNHVRIDIDNLIKSVMDAITSAGIWHDDSQLQEVVAEVTLGDKNPRVEFVIYRVKNISAFYCIQCGKEIPRQKVHPSYKRKYCSLACWAAAHKAKLICPTCGKEFIMAKSKIKQSKTHYCSRPCLLTALAKKRVKETSKSKCQDCGAPVSRKEYKRCWLCAKKARIPKTNYWENRVTADNDGLVKLTSRNEKGKYPMTEVTIETLKSP